jgi:CCR4-NOT transcription complex subunit 6
LEKRSYQGIYTKKSRDGKDGLAIFFKKGKFRLLGEERVDLNEKTQEVCAQKQVDPISFKLLQNTVALFAHLELLEKEGEEEEEGKAKRSIAVGNVHIHYDWMRNDLQSLQVALTLQALDAFSKSRGNPPSMLCGDFNIQPFTPSYSLLSQGLWEREAWLKSNHPPGFHGNESAFLGDLLQETFFRPQEDWTSAYHQLLGKEPETTNCASHFSGCLDYIWFSGKTLRPSAVLALPEEAVMNQLGGCPNQKFPSDHLSLMAQFELL